MIRNGFYTGSREIVQCNPQRRGATAAKKHIEQELKIMLDEAPARSGRQCVNDVKASLVQVSNMSQSGKGPIFAVPPLAYLEQERGRPRPRRLAISGLVPGTRPSPPLWWYGKDAPRGNTASRWTRTL